MSEEAKAENQSPKVSVIVPVYKAEKYLRKCVDSILAQTFRDFEIILVDDGSPDGSGAICDEYAAEYDCVRVKHISNGGAAVARNRGIDMAKGEFIMFVDSDDTIESDMLAELVSLQKRHKVDIAASKLYVEKSFPIESIYLGEECVRLLLQEKIDSSPCAKLFARKCIGETRFPEGVTNEDIVFLFYVYEKGLKLCYLNKSFYHITINPLSVTRNLGRNAVDLVTNVNRIYSEVQNNHPDLEPVARTYKVKIYLQFCYIVITRNLFRLCEEEYRYCRSQCLQKIISILASFSYSWKYKCKSLMVLFASPMLYALKRTE